MPKTAKVVATAIFPQEASPAATLIMFCSAGPKSKKRSGNSWPNRWANVETLRSPPTTTTSLFSCPSSSNAFPKASLVAIDSIVFP